jgi:hypothetical protein
MAREHDHALLARYFIESYSVVCTLFCNGDNEKANLELKRRRAPTTGDILCGIFCRKKRRFVDIELFLDAFAELRKVTVCFAMSICLSVHMKQLDYHWTNFNEILYLHLLENPSSEFVLLKSDKNKGYFT